MNELEIKGKFGVEIYDKNNNLIGKNESNNVVTNSGILQIKRWLDRPEYVSNPLSYSNWKDTICVAGECRRITVAPQYSSYSVSYMDDYPVTYGRPFDGSYETQWIWFAENNANAQFMEINFKDSFHLKRMGMVWWNDSSSGWDGSGINFIRFKIEGYNISGAGTSGYNGSEYLREYIDYNGYPCYRKEGESYYLFVNEAKTKWILSTSLGGAPAYSTNGVNLPSKPSLGTWELGTGSPNAPTVTEGTAKWREPFFMLNGLREVEGSALLSRHMQIWGKDPQMRGYMSGNDYEDITKAGYCLQSYEGITGWHSSTYNFNHNWYGFIPFVKSIRIEDRVGDAFDSLNKVSQIHIYEAIMHPQNPYALKLGTDDGTVLPLGASNTSLGSYVSGMQWKCDSVTQRSNYTVRFSRRVLPEEANGITFKEIGLFGNLDGHLVQNRTEPMLTNATGIFARALFDIPWSKTADQTAVIYYDISVSDNT